MTSIFIRRGKIGKEKIFPTHPSDQRTISVTWRTNNKKQFDFKNEEITFWARHNCGIMH